MMKIPHTLKSATILSLLVHLLFGVALGAVLVRRPPITFGNGPLAAPMVLTLKQPAKPKPTPEPVIQMIESPVEAETPPDITELISDVNSQAADETPTVGEQQGPAPEVIDDLATLAARRVPSESAAPSMPPAPPVPPELTPPAASRSEAQPEVQSEPPAEQEPPEPSAAEERLSKRPERKPVSKSHSPAFNPDAPSPPKEVSEDTLASAIPTQTSGAFGQPGEGESNRDLESFQVAKADAPPLAPEGLQDKTRGKIGDAAVGEGFTSFDAIRDQIAPYLKSIKTKVEKCWNAEIINRYDGHMPTEATVDCAVSPDGKVISVEVVGAPKDRPYAALCKRAIERAGPFGPFPFEVPEMYRSKNLEIRWTFSFLR